MVVLTMAFGVTMHLWQFSIIDEMYVADDIAAHIQAMTETQKTVHAWMTGTLDVAYPFAYGAFFIGIAMRYFGRFGIFLAMPSLLCIPVDLIEGLAQIMLLTGHEDWMNVKILVTPIKLFLYIPGAFITLIGLGLALKKRFY
ncbi:MAG: hypothetical protein ABJG88_13600 [Litorimonas sp.]